MAVNEKGRYGRREFIISSVKRVVVPVAEIVAGGVINAQPDSDILSDTARNTIGRSLVATGAITALTGRPVDSLGKGVAVGVVSSLVDATQKHVEINVK